jgi:hypothetical protein
MFEQRLPAYGGSVGAATVVCQRYALGPRLKACRGRDGRCLARHEEILERIYVH